MGCLFYVMRGYDAMRCLSDNFQTWKLPNRFCGQISTVIAYARNPYSILISILQDL